MKIEKEDYKIIAAIAIGAIGGVILGSYIWGTKSSDNKLSKHISTLGKVLEEIEGINTEDSENLKERIHNVLTAIESNYGNNKE